MGVGPANDDVPGAGSLHQLDFKQEIVNTAISAQKLSCLSAVEGLAKSKILRTPYQAAYLLSAHKLAL